MTHRTGTQDGRATSGAEGGQARSGSRVFAALGQLVTRHPWRVIGAWIIVAVAVIATAPKLPTTSNEASFLPSSYESINRTRRSRRPGRLTPRPRSSCSRARTAGG
jgi:hypothetical protein